ncbi:3-hydroxylacyl-ACP dehydratase [Solihabitans fulvus]|uniref:3-hydroxylacyl-ACP dehydratase n=1 Tax=Solihabitans fulvus TaxID=1892852 RepID=A0A5B2XHE4_9PSEU|nr:3-hydroxylacyl-ACP dehydratase [Solihabitans fulvus]KAA2262626.1 3-hydroxylacyl-ACP dehydratase [Solihabitans fulvus]
MSFYLVDRIDSLIPGQSVLARKSLSGNEDYWRWDGGSAHLPAELLLESLCQAGSWLVLASTDFGRRAALLSVDEVDCPGTARAGDVLRIHGSVESLGERTAALSGVVSVRGTPVLAARGILCALVPAARLEDPAHTMRRYEALCGRERST